DRRTRREPAPRGGRGGRRGESSGRPRATPAPHPDPRGPVLREPSPAPPSSSWWLASAVSRRHHNGPVGAAPRDRVGEGRAAIFPRPERFEPETRRKGRATGDLLP